MAAEAAAAGDAASCFREEGQAARAPAAINDTAQVQKDAALSGRLHVSSAAFRRSQLEDVERWLRESSAVSVQEVFKLTSWGYAFVSVQEEDVAKFCESMRDATFKGSSITVKAGNSRKADDDGENGKTERPAKRRKLKEFPDGYVPTLKDLKDKEKQRRREVEASVMQKSAPLFQWPYDTQLDMKGTYIKTAVRTLTKQVRKCCEDEAEEVPAWTTPEWCTALQAPQGCGCPLDKPLGTASDHLEGYRNKCEFTIGVREDGSVECGYVLRVSGDGKQVVDSAEQTPHTPEPMKRLCRAVRELVRASQFSIYDRSRDGRTGVWRLVMARLAPTGDMLVMVQVASPDTKEEEDKLERSIIEHLSVDELRIVSIYLQINDTPTDAARPDAPMKLLHGREKLIMPLLELQFEIGPLSFFQANSSTCAALYRKAIDWLEPKVDSVVFDVCCGVGSIGLCAASQSKKVIGLELVAEAVESAKQNAARNGITNAEFHVGRAEETLPKLLSDLDETADVCAIVDPPRPGLHSTVLYALKSCTKLSRLVYVSCNPDSMVEDVTKLCIPREGFEPFVPLRAVAVDMFPHTLHCEMIMLLKRQSKVVDPRA
mmetsp:Transcript_23426/g.54092  ORF Transcript_23426/g.54092 Transcript_23426/m.54092 type:complete len:601 (-) Transcript_23426:109-1911(-)